jgi:hypothetical protein
LSNGKFSSFDYPGAADTVATRINDSAEIVGYYGASGLGPFSGYLENKGGFNSVNFPGASETRVLGINKAGTVVGRYTDFSGVVHGFMGTP